MFFFCFLRSWYPLKESPQDSQPNITRPKLARLSTGRSGPMILQICPKSHFRSSGLGPTKSLNLWFARNMVQTQKCDKLKPMKSGRAPRCVASFWLKKRTAQTILAFPVCTQLEMQTPDANSTQLPFGDPNMKDYQLLGALAKN